jgi:hypothetical protein
VRSPNHDDAALYLRLHALKDTAVQAEARAWFFEHFEAASYSDLQQRYPPGSRERHLLSEFLGFYEGAGVLVSRGLLHEDVYFDAPFALELVWEKIGPLMDEWQAAGGPAAWENVVWLGRRYDEWSKKRWRPKMEAVPPKRGPRSGDLTKVRGSKRSARR